MRARWTSLMRRLPWKRPPRAAEALLSTVGMLEVIALANWMASGGHLTVWAQWFRWGWFLAEVVSAAVGAAALLLMALVPGLSRPPFLRRGSHVLVCTSVCEAAAVGFGMLGVAACIGSLGSLARHAACIERRRIFWSVPPAVAALALMLGVAIGSFHLAIAAAAVGWALGVLEVLFPVALRGASLRNAIAGKPVRDALVRSWCSAAAPRARTARASTLRVLVEARAFGEALAELKRLHDRLPPDGMGALRSRTCILARMGHPQTVLDDLASVSPSFDGLEVPAALAFAALGDHARAGELAQKVIDKRGSDGERTMAKVCRLAGDDEGALTYYERAANRITGDAYDLLGAGRALHRLGNHRDAAALLQKGLRLADFLWPDDLAMLAEGLRATGREREAREADAMRDELVETGAIAAKPTATVAV